MTLPEPLTPAGCNLQDFAFMPLDVARLRDSDLAANESPEACWAAVQLWSSSWHQVPAASIPDDDKWLAQQTGYGRIVKSWLKVRAGALRGWIKCADGRLYHPVVAEKALDAWKAKLEQRWRTECARIKKHNERHGTGIIRLTLKDWLSSGCPSGQLLFVPSDNPVCPSTVISETPSKGEGEGQGQGELIHSVAKATGVPPGLPVDPLVPGALPPLLTAHGKPMLTDPGEIIFGYGLSMLVNAGTKESTARSFLGLLRKTNGDAVLIDKLRECAKAKALQPLEWLAAALPPPSVIDKENEGGEPAPAFVLPEWLPADTWAAYLETRKEKKAKSTAFALGLVVATLEQLKAAGHDPIDALNRSIKAGWTDVYPPKMAPGFPDKNAVPAVSTVWHESAAGVALKAAELGLAPQLDVESHPAFRSRVLAVANQAPLKLNQLAAMAENRKAA